MPILEIVFKSALPSALTTLWAALSMLSATFSGSCSRCGSARPSADASAAGLAEPQREQEPEKVAESIERAAHNVVKALGKALLKTISKMGISTIQSYCGAQIFEAVGLERALIDRHFTGTASRIGGVGLEQLSTEAMERHFRAYPRTDRELLPVGGVLQWRRNGEIHVWNPDTVAKLQHAAQRQNGDPRQTYSDFAELANDESTRRAALRGLMRLRTVADPVPL